MTFALFDHNIYLMTIIGPRYWKDIFVQKKKPLNEVVLKLSA